MRRPGRQPVPGPDRGAGRRAGRAAARAAAARAGARRPGRAGRRGTGRARDTRGCRVAAGPRSTRSRSRACCGTRSATCSPTPCWPYGAGRGPGRVDERSGDRRGVPVGVLSEDVAGELVDHHCHGVTTADLDDDGRRGAAVRGRRPGPGRDELRHPARAGRPPALRAAAGPGAACVPARVPGPAARARAGRGEPPVPRRDRHDPFCVDTGFRPDGLTTPEQLAAIGGGTGHHVVRLETVAEALAAGGVEPGELAGPVRRAAGRDGPGQRGGRGEVDRRIPDRARPGPDSAGAGRGRRGRRGLGRCPARAPGAGPDDARRRGRARAADPVPHRLRRHRHPDVPGRPDAAHRLAASAPGAGHAAALLAVPAPGLYLAAVHPHVHLDVGLALHYVGPTRAGRCWRRRPSGPVRQAALLLGRLRPAGAVPPRRADVPAGARRPAGRADRSRRVVRAGRRPDRPADRARQRRRRVRFA